ncbi:TPA: helix-turn-helix transcriptional regulator [Yersinia enterocolitica]|nr:helix-turn-helix transcriptional regulator [Yersinia enterocolitica]
MLNISIISRDIYLKNGISEIVKEKLSEIKKGYREDANYFDYKNTHILFIDVSQIDWIIELNREILSAEPTDLFMITSRKDRVLYLEPLTVNSVNNITNLLLDDSLYIFKKNIMTGLKRIIIKNSQNGGSHHVSVVGGALNKILTKQENIVIQLFKNGLPGSHIAKILNKSEKTVSHQKRSAMKKMGVRTNCELMHQILKFALH